MGIDREGLTADTEGLSEFQQFRLLVSKALSVPHGAIQRRIKAQQELSARKPKRGPKPKSTTTPSQ